MTPSPLSRQQGFSLAELMVAVAIGLMITLAIGTLFITSQRDTRQNDAISRMQENARFAMELLTNDMRHAGFMGSIPNPADIDVGTMTLNNPTSSCGPLSAGGKPGLYNFERVRDMLSFGNQISPANITAYYDSCLVADDKVKANSSILLIKHVARIQTWPLLQDDPTTPDDELNTDNRIAGYTYCFANGSNALLYTHPSLVPPPITGGEHWEYQPHIYFIMDEDSNDNDRLDAGEDTNGNGRLDKDVLYRKQLVGLDLNSEPLAEGIEAFHVEFGIDVANGGTFNGTPDYFFSPAADSDPWAAAEMDDPVSATIYILARTTSPNPDTSYGDTKTYQLGSTGPLIDPPDDDRFTRRVYSITVELKNLRSQIMAR